jgi:hypothetical protein
MSMSIIQAPEKLEVEGISCFLAGGISHCSLWQDTIIEVLENHCQKQSRSWTLLNPRREDFPANYSAAAREQIEWEFCALQKADALLFWFPMETLCPITLFELGRWIAGDKPLFIGTDPEYRRRFDVEVQTRLVHPNAIIHSTLEGLGAAVAEGLNAL